MFAAMTHPASHTFAAIAAYLVAVAPSFAESFATSASSAATSASSAGSASLRGSSDSLRGSSDSSSGDTRDRKAAVADGDYRVAAIQPIEGRSGMLRLTMQPVSRAANGGFELDLPARALDKRSIELGEVVTARRHRYGLELARGAPREPFFLVLADAWNRDLETRPLGD